MTITFKPNQLFSGIQAIQNVGQMWDMKLTMPPVYDEWVSKRRKFIEIYAGATEGSLANVLLNAPADKWDALIAETAGEEQIKGYIRDNSGPINASINARIDEIIASAETFDHIMGQLPIDDVEADFMDAVAILGDAVGDAEASIDRDADAAARFRVAGRKLILLPSLLSGMHSEFMMFAEFGELKELTYSFTGRFTEKHYSEGDMVAHRQVQGARNKSTHDQGQWLVDLARGEFPGVKLNTARTYAVVQERREAAEGAGHTTRVNEAKPRGPRTAMI